MAGTPFILVAPGWPGVVGVSGGRWPRLGQQFVNKLTADNSDLTLAVLGDSTGNGVDEWPYLLTSRMATNFPTRLVRYKLYASGTGLYGTQRLFNASAGTAKLVDTFDRADGALGTTTSGGQSYAANSFTIAGNKAVPPAGGGSLVSTGLTGASRVIAQVDVTWRGTGTGDYRLYARYGSATSFLMANLSATGVLTLFVNTGGGSSSIATSAVSGITIDTVYTIQLVCDGVNVQASVSGTVIAASLTAVQDAALTGNLVHIASVTPATNHLFDNLSLSLIGNARTLDVYNASVAGWTPTDHLPVIDDTIPVQPDLLMLCLGINPATDTPEDFMADYNALIDAALVAWPATPVVSLSENPTNDANATAHAARQAAIKQAAASYRRDHVDMRAAYLANAGWPATLLSGDNIHPSAAGSILSEATIASRFGLA